MQTSYSYLDVVGRTTVVLKKKNVVGEHNVPFQVLVHILMRPCRPVCFQHPRQRLPGQAAIQAVDFMRLVVRIAA